MICEVFRKYNTFAKSFANVNFWFAKSFAKTQKKITFAKSFANVKFTFAKLSLRSNNNCAVQKNHFLFSHLNVFSHFFREVSWKIVATTNSRPNCFADLIGPPTTHCPLYYLRLYLMPLLWPWQLVKNPISQLFIEWTAMVNLNENNPVVAFCCVVRLFCIYSIAIRI